MLFRASSSPNDSSHVLFSGGKDRNYSRKFQIFGKKFTQMWKKYLFFWRKSPNFATKSEEYGYDCEMMGFAANSQLEEHYVNSFGAIRIHMLHPYQILIPAESGHQIKEVYTYEWTDEEL